MDATPRPAWGLCRGGRDGRHERGRGTRRVPGATDSPRHATTAARFRLPRRWPDRYSFEVGGVGSEGGCVETRSDRVAPRAWNQAWTRRPAGSRNSTHTPPTTWESDVGWTASTVARPPYICSKACVSRARVASSSIACARAADGRATTPRGYAWRRSSAATYLRHSLARTNQRARRPARGSMRWRALPPPSLRPTIGVPAARNVGASVPRVSRATAPAGLAPVPTAARGPRAAPRGPPASPGERRSRPRESVPDPRCHPSR